MEKERFEIQKSGIRNVSALGIIIDKETGVQYLFAASGTSGGLTLLVDREGKPLINENYK